MRSRKINFIALAAIVVAAAAVRSASAAPEWGGVDDVPTWQAGDKWDFRRSFFIDVDGSLEATTGITAIFELTLAVTDDYTLEVNPTAPIQDKNNGLRGFQTSKAYVRSRTAGQASVTFSGRLTVNDTSFQPDFTADVIVTFPGPLNTATGENWIGVSDLAQIREQFQAPLTTGTLLVTGQGSMGNNNQLCQLLPFVGLTCGVPASATIGLDIALDHAVVNSNGGPTTGGLELLDFPHIDSAAGDGTGEIWTAVGFRGINGNVTLGIPGLLDPPESFAFNTDAPLNYELALQDKAIDDLNTPPLYPGATRQVTGTIVPQNDNLFYAPAAKEIAYWRVGDLDIPVDTLLIKLRSFVTRLRSTAGVVLGPDSDIGGSVAAADLVINPPIPDSGQAFTVSGSYDDLSLPPTTMISAEVLVPGGGGSTDTILLPLGGNFTFNLTAPVIPDTTPSKPGVNFEKEWGSFGIRIVRDGVANPHLEKVLTVRTFDPAINAAEGWAIYE